MIKYVVKPDRSVSIEITQPKDADPASRDVATWNSVQAVDTDETRTHNPLNPHHLLRPDDPPNPRHAAPSFLSQPASGNKKEEKITPATSTGCTGTTTTSNHPSSSTSFTRPPPPSGPMPKKSVSPTACPQILEHPNRRNLPLQPMMNEPQPPRSLRHEIDEEKKSSITPTIIPPPAAAARHMGVVGHEAYHARANPALKQSPLRPTYHSHSFSSDTQNPASDCLPRTPSVKPPPAFRVQNAQEPMKCTTHKTESAREGSIVSHIPLSPRTSSIPHTSSDAAPGRGDTVRMKAPPTNRTIMSYTTQEPNEAPTGVPSYKGSPTESNRSRSKPLPTKAAAATPPPMCDDMYPRIKPEEEEPQQPACESEMPLLGGRQSFRGNVITPTTHSAAVLIKQIKGYPSAHHPRAHDQTSDAAVLRTPSDDLHPRSEYGMNMGANEYEPYLISAEPTPPSYLHENQRPLHNPCTPLTHSSSTPVIHALNEVRPSHREEVKGEPHHGCPGHSSSTPAIHGGGVGENKKNMGHGQSDLKNWGSAASTRDTNSTSETRDMDMHKRHGKMEDYQNPGADERNLELGDEFLQKNLVGNFRDYYDYRTQGKEDPRVRVIHSRIEGLRCGGNVLDVGCNEGAVTRELAILCPTHKFLGIDLDETLIQKGVRLKKETNTDFRVHNIINSGIPDGNWDIVLLLSVARWIHLQTGDDYMKHLFQQFGERINPGGMLVMENSYSYEHCSKALKEKGMEVPSLEFPPQEFVNYLTTECGFIYQHEFWEYPEYRDDTQPCFSKRYLEFAYKGNNCPKGHAMRYLDGSLHVPPCSRKGCISVKAPYYCQCDGYHLCDECFRDTSPKPPEPLVVEAEMVENHSKINEEKCEQQRIPEEEGNVAWGKEDVIVSKRPIPVEKIENCTYDALCSYHNPFDPEEDYLKFDLGEKIMFFEEDDLGWALGEKVATKERGWFPGTYIGYLNGQPLMCA